MAKNTKGRQSFWKGSFT